MAIPVECWDIVEIALSGPQVGATFCHRHRTVSVDGFDDGGKPYRAVQIRRVG